MNFKQQANGYIEAYFKPEEMLTLVRLVKTAEEMRIVEEKRIATENLKIIAEAGDVALSS